MAKVNTFFDLLEKGFNAAEKESEKIDMINQLASFCDHSGIYFNNDLYLDFESALVQTIEYANSLTYRYEEFESQYKNILHRFLLLKNWYLSLFEGKLISYAIQYMGNQAGLRKCLSTLFTYSRIDIEVVILDCSGAEMETKKILNTFFPASIVYKKSDCTVDWKNELALLEQCSGIFVFPLREDAIYLESSIPFLVDIIMENPQAGAIYTPRPDGNRLTEEGLNWEVVSPNGIKIQVARDLTEKTGFGYRRENVDIAKDIPLYTIEKPLDIYNHISERVSQTDESILFCLPIYALK